MILELIITGIIGQGAQLEALAEEVRANIEENSRQAIHKHVEELSDQLDALYTELFNLNTKRFQALGASAPDLDAQYKSIKDKIAPLQKEYDDLCKELND